MGEEWGSAWICAKAFQLHSRKGWGLPSALTCPPRSPLSGHPFKGGPVGPLRFGAQSSLLAGRGPAKPHWFGETSYPCLL